MQIDPRVEWQRLSEQYTGMYDDELLDLASDRDSLTETARQVLAMEMLKRGLSERRAASNRPEPRLDRRAALTGNQGGASQIVLDERSRQEEDIGTTEYTWKTLLCECETVEQGRQLYAVLKHAGIDCWLEEPGRGQRYGGFDVTYPRIMVVADQLDAARQVAALPILDEIAEEEKPVEMPEFKAPVCPGCGAPDPALEGVDPFNTWRCEACGRQWTETEDEETRLEGEKGSKNGKSRPATGQLNPQGE